MASTEFDTLAATRELRAAGIEAAHAEALVSTMSRTTGGLLTESRFKSAMAEQTAYLDKRLDKRLAEERAYLDQRLAAERAYLEQRIDLRAAEQTAALAGMKSEIYRYLWLHGSMIVLVLTSLYAMVETWSRGQL